MKVTDRMVEIIQGMNMDDDLRQDVYVKLLDMDDDRDERTDQTIRALVNKVYCGLKANRDHVERNRRRLEEENLEEIQRTFNMHEIEPDPMDALEGEQEFERKLKLLSPLLEDTMNYMTDGGTAAEAAKHFGVTENTIYQRMWQAKVILEGE